MFGSVLRLLKSKSIPITAPRNINEENLLQHVTPVSYYLHKIGRSWKETSMLSDYVSTLNQKERIQSQFGFSSVVSSEQKGASPSS